MVVVVVVVMMMIFLPIIEQPLGARYGTYMISVLLDHPTE